MPENYFDVGFDHYLNRWLLQYEGEILGLNSQDYESALEEAEAIVEACQ